jgi:hypothetical protein
MLADAAKIIGSEPASIQLRYLQTLTEIATERNSTIIFPVPLELLSLIPHVGSAAATMMGAGTGTPPAIPRHEVRPAQAPESLPASVARVGTPTQAAPPPGFAAPPPQPGGPAPGATRPPSGIPGPPAQG